MVLFEMLSPNCVCNCTQYATSPRRPCASRFMQSRHSPLATLASAMCTAFEWLPFLIHAFYYRGVRALHRLS